MEKDGRICGVDCRKNDDEGKKDFAHFVNLRRWVAFLQVSEIWRVCSLFYTIWPFFGRFTYWWNGDQKADEQSKKRPFTILRPSFRDERRNFSLIRGMIALMGIPSRGFFKKHYDLGKKSFKNGYSSCFKVVYFWREWVNK